MKISDRTITLKCLFCQAELVGSAGKEYLSGDLVKCASCGEENDFDSVLEVAKEVGMKEVAKEVEGQLAKQFKNLFK